MNAFSFGKVVFSWTVIYYYVYFGIYYFYSEKVQIKFYKLKLIACALIFDLHKLHFWILNFVPSKTQVLQNECPHGNNKMGEY